MSLPIFPPEVRCDGCRHWFQYHVKVLGVCERADSTDGVADHAEAEAVALVDGAGDFPPDGYLRTTAGHGCRQWEARP